MRSSVKSNTDLRTFLPSVLLIGTFIFLYGEVLASLVREWWSSNTYSFGFLIPAISLYLIWIQRERLRSVHPIPSPGLGITVLTLSLITFLLAHAGRVLIIQELSIPVTFTGIVLLLYGIPVLKIMWFPIAYLFLGIPFWEFFTDHLHQPFQVFSAKIGVGIIHTLGIPAFLDGIYITLPNITLKVGRMCSGINFLIAVIALGIPLSYIYLSGWKKRVVLVFSAVLVAILSNGLRVALIGFLAFYGVSGATHGPFHILQGVFVSLMGFLAIFAGLWFFSDGFPGATLSHDHHKDDRGEADSPSPKYERNPVPRFMLSFVFILMGSFTLFYRPSPVPLSMSMDYFPAQIDQWKGTKALPAIADFTWPEADDVVSRNYMSPEGEMISLYIGYFGSQDQERELVNYKTASLNYNTSRQTIELPDHPAINVNRTIYSDKNGSGKHLVLFWYDLNGRIIANRYLAKFYSTWDAIFRGRTNGALIMLTKEIPTGEAAQDEIAEMMNFARKVYSITRHFLPT